MAELIDEEVIEGPSEEELESQLAEKHKQFMEQFQAAKRAWGGIHGSYMDDQKFADGDQWDAKVKSAREAANLSVLVYNQLPAKYKYIVNNIRKNMPGPKIHAISGGANPNTARVYEGIIRYLDLKHNSKEAFAYALTCAVIGGIGAMKVLPIRDRFGEYDIEIQRILDPTSVYLDPNANKSDFSDAKWGFHSFWVSKKEAERYGEGAGERSLGGKETGGMFTKDSVLLLEYWCLNEDTGYFEQYILNGEKILTSNTEYRGAYLPLIVLTGEEKYIDGERIYKGIVRDVKDMQILMNLVKSKIADYVARSSNQQWLVEGAQIEGFEDLWLSANVNGIPVLPYHATAAGAPQRLEPPAPPTGFMQVSESADADIRNAIGIRDPLETMPSNVASKTVEMQISQSNIGTYEYIDKLKDIICYCAKVRIDLIPYYFGYEHVREIMGADSQISTVQLNAPYEENGQTVMHDLALGRYGVSISDGPSYESNQAEAVDRMTDIAKAYPPFMQLAGDIYFKNLDFDGASEIADRLRAQIPPNILAASSASNADGKGPDAAIKLQTLQQQLAQKNQENQQLHQLLQAAQQEKATKADEEKNKLTTTLAINEQKHEQAKEMQDRQAKIDHSADLLDNHTKIFTAEINHAAALERGAHLPNPTMEEIE